MKERWISGFGGDVLRVTALKRRAFFLAADGLMIYAAIYAAFLVRFDFAVPGKYTDHIFEYGLLALVVKFVFLILFGQYNISWRFYSLSEMMRLFQALALSSVAMGAAIFLFRPLPLFAEFPRSILILDFVFSLALIGGLRIAKRVVLGYRIWPERSMQGRTRVLIVGAGSAGEQIGREMLNNRKSKYFPVGYVDDDPAKKGISIHGIRVLGGRRDIPEIVKSYMVDEILVAIPSAASGEIRKIVEIIREGNTVKSIKILPGIMDIMEGEVTLSDIQEIQVEDLLGRDPVTIDYESVRGFLAGKRVLITGAGGSIGGELTRTVLSFKPAKLAALDIDETELFDLMNRLHPLGLNVIPVVGDVRNRERMAVLFATFKPEVVIHSAAYKHVPILESFPEEAVGTNILGTKILAELAAENGVEKFVNISTDKAINPTSVMGASKRAAEELLRSMTSGKETRFISVRFGNVLGSRGSVIPLFKEQIKKGGPVTVTHPEMKRYFMAISEAVLLVLAAAAAGEGGETYVLDMGEPVKIVDLARDMIRLSRFEPDVEIPIVYTGLRPGEKLFEELLGAEEGSEPTDHPKIFRARSSRKSDGKKLLEKVERLIDMCRGSCRKEDVQALLRDIVPTYVANGGTLSSSPRPAEKPGGGDPEAEDSGVEDPGGGDPGGKARPRKSRGLVS
ncbi:MAG: nucleoside-diphosphate sugar epimerase/dehydratase [Acidobacteriota bacterium]|nr:nucleoside-diphosphate sugar epimerase/dehydratase [Acidobacteriota bacterium]